MTIRELWKLYQIDLKKKLNDGTTFAAYQGLFDDGYCYETKQSCSALLSNVGRFRSRSEKNKNLKNSITNMSVGTTKMPTKETKNVIGLLAFSKEKYGKNTLVYRLEQPSSVINGEDANLLMKSITYMMFQFSMHLMNWENFKIKLINKP